MTRLIDADTLKYEPLPKGEITYHPYTLDDAYKDGYDDAFENVRNAPTIDAISISFIEKKIESIRQYLSEHEGEEFTSGLISKAIAYERLIEEWIREHD